MDALEIRPPREEDVAALLAAQARAFPARTPPTRAQWAWAQAQNPAGARALLAFRGGELAGAFSGRAVRVLQAGRVRAFTLATDVFTVPERCAGLARRSVYLALATAFFARYGGPGGDLVHYGLPVERTRRAGRERLGWASLGTALVCVREARPVARARAPRVAPIARFDEQARWLYERCCGAFAVSAVRDAAYLNWRHVDAPTPAELRLGARDAQGLLRGFAVAHPLAVGGVEVLAVLEWLVPPEEAAVGDELLLALEAHSGGRPIAVHVPAWSPWFARLQERGFRVHPAPFRLAVRAFARECDIELLRTGWWWQLGELDLV